VDVAIRLADGAAELGVVLHVAAIEKLERYLQLLLAWNARINLTSVTDPVEVVDRHFLDSLAILPLLTGARTLIDIGTGAGFPGAVAAIARPDLRVTLVEATQKKVAFLRTLKRELGIDVEPVAARDEALPANTFDAAVSRATWDPSIWLEHGARFVGAGGVLIAMQTAAQPRLDAPAGFSTLDPFEPVIAGARRRIQGFRRTQ
jgi:16S rRNA (guanine527-N7)-methyltransferase